VGTAAVVRSAPDGYSLLLLSIVEMITATLYDKAGFDFANDIVPVSGILSGPFIMVVNPSVAAKTVPEFIAYAKANPGKINMASAGNGTPQHVYGELFKLQTGINLVHVPYRGSAPAMTDLISGQVQVAFEPMGSALQYVRAGQLRALAISSAKQMEGLQEFPTIAEFVPGFEISGFTGIGVPRGTPRDIVERLNREINLSLDDATIKKYGADNYRVPMKGSQESFARFVKGEIEKSARAIKAANIKAE
jgi:tripartite-type tricarboxylate transporter receptor subunit TctC